MSETFLFTSESVGEGHPGKIIYNVYAKFPGFNKVVLL